MSAARLPIFPPSTICAPCGGHCCKQYPGRTNPENWGAPDREAMRARLADGIASGRWAIDIWYGESFEKAPLNADVLIVRPAINGREGMAYDFESPADEDSYSRFFLHPPPRPCTFHGPSGCELSDEARPVECMTLEPIAGKCKQHSDGIRDVALEWAEYQDVLQQAT